jgi:predicted DNA-binding antitoxin AbrB/MazE fold protein
MSCFAMMMCASAFNPSASRMATITAIYENGVFRPLEPVHLPEHARVEFEPRVQPAGSEPPTLPEGLGRVFNILSRRYKSGHHDTAERHNEHQP